MKITYSSLLGALTGHLGGPRSSLTFANAQSGKPVARKRRNDVPNMRANPHRQFATQAMKFLDNYWNTLTTDQKLIWTRAARGTSRVPRSGMDLYRSVNVPRLFAGWPALEGPPIRTQSQRATLTGQYPYVNIPPGTVKRPWRQGQMETPSGPQPFTQYAASIETPTQMDFPPWTTDIGPMRTLQVGSRGDGYCTPTGCVTWPANQPLAIGAVPNPLTCTRLLYWLLQGEEIGDANPITIAPYDYRTPLTAVFQTLPEVTPPVTHSAGGTVIPYPPLPECPYMQATFYFYPDPGYHIDEVYYAGDPIGQPPSFTYDPLGADPETLHVEFAPDVSCAYAYKVVLASMSPGFNCILRQGTYYAYYQDYLGPGLRGPGFDGPGWRAYKGGSNAFRLDIYLDAGQVWVESRNLGIQPTYWHTIPDAGCPPEAAYVGPSGYCTGGTCTVSIHLMDPP